MLHLGYEDAVLETNEKPDKMMQNLLFTIFFGKVPSYAHQITLIR